LVGNSFRGKGSIFGKVWAFPGLRLAFPGGLISIPEGGRLTPGWWLLGAGTTWVGTQVGASVSTPGVPSFRLLKGGQTSFPQNLFPLTAPNGQG